MDWLFLFLIIPLFLLARHIDTRRFRHEPVGYDPHRTRELESEQGVPVRMLTTCDTERCATCLPTITAEAMAQDILEEAEGRRRELETQSKELDRKLSTHARYTKPYSVMEFRPKQVPHYATYDITGDRDIVVLWKYDEKTYRQPLKDYVFEDGMLYFKKRTVAEWRPIIYAARDHDFSLQKYLNDGLISFDLRKEPDSYSPYNYLWYDEDGALICQSHERNIRWRSASNTI